MIVYKDLFSGDEAISDSYKIVPVMDGEEEVPGLFEVESTMIAVGSGDVDIGCGNAFGGAAEDEGVDDSVEKENNIAGARGGFGYTQLPFGSKGEFKEYLKEYVQKVRQELKSAGTPVEEIKKFMSEAPVFVKWLLSKYDDIETFMTKSMNPDGGMVYSYYKEGASYPTFVYVKAGYKVAKF